METAPVNDEQMAAFEEEQQRQKALKAKQAAALGKITKLISDKVHEHLIDEIQYYSFGQQPVLYDKKGSTVPQQLWKSKENIKVLDVIKASENWNESPLKKFFDIIDKSISSSKDVVTLHRKLCPADCENGNLDAIEDEIIELFFTKNV